MNFIINFIDLVELKQSIKFFILILRLHVIIIMSPSIYLLLPLYVNLRHQATSKVALLDQKIPSFFLIQYLRDLNHYYYCSSLRNPILI